MRCAITGAAGFVGGAIAKHFTHKGWTVLNLGRRRTPDTEEFCKFELTDNPKALPWDGVDALVLCAWDFGARDWAEIERVNVQGSIALLREAKARGVKNAVFISSFSCFEGCRSLYGKAKLEVERETLALGYTVVRPGLVYGETSGSIVGKMEKSVAGSKFIPLIGDGSYPQYPVHAEDLAEFVYRTCQPGAPVSKKPLSAAPQKIVTLRGIVETIAARTGRKVTCVPVPWQILYSGFKLLEWLHLPSPFRSDSILGIVFQNRAPDFELPPEFATTFRDFR